MKSSAKINSFIPAAIIYLDSVSNKLVSALDAPSHTGFKWNNGTQSTMHYIKQIRSPNSSLLVFLCVYMLASCVPVNQWDLGVCLAQRWKGGID